MKFLLSLLSLSVSIASVQAMDIINNDESGRTLHIIVYKTTGVTPDASSDACDSSNRGTEIFRVDVPANGSILQVAPAVAKGKTDEVLCVLADAEGFATYKGYSQPFYASAQNCQLNIKYAKDSGMTLGSKPQMGDNDCFKDPTPNSSK